MDTVQDISALIKQLAGEKVEVVNEAEEEVEEAKPYIESDYEINTPGWYAALPLMCSRQLQQITQQMCVILKNPLARHLPFIYSICTHF